MAHSFILGENDGCWLVWQAKRGRGRRWAAKIYLTNQRAVAEQVETVAIRKGIGPNEMSLFGL